MLIVTRCDLAQSVAAMIDNELVYEPTLSAYPGLLTTVFGMTYCTFVDCFFPTDVAHLVILLSVIFFPSHLRS